MSLLLDLLKTAHTVYKNMEDARALPYFDGVLPSFVPRGLSSKAHILEDLFKLFFGRMLAEPAVAHDKDLANEILKLKHPDSEKNLPTCNSEAKDDNIEKTKLAIILDILRACALLETNKTAEYTAEKSVNEARPRFQAAFAGIKEADYFIFKAYEFVRLTSKMVHLTQRCVETELEAGQKTGQITKLNAKIQTLESALSDVETKHQALEQTLAQTTQEHITASAENCKLVDAQKQYDTELVRLKNIVYGSEKHLIALEDHTMLDKLKKSYDELKIAYSQNHTYAKKAQDKILKLKADLTELHKINAVLEAQQALTSNQSKASNSSVAESVKSLLLASKTPPMPVTGSMASGVFTNFRSGSLFSNRSSVSTLNNNISTNAQATPGQQRVTVGISTPIQTKPRGLGGPYG